MKEGATVRVVVGYQLQGAILENGWPQSSRSISGALRQATSKGKGKGRGDGGKGKSLGAGDTPRLPCGPRDFANVFDQ
eukprot:5595958-Pyramimonas_sp.AAC.1